MHYFRSFLSVRGGIILAFVTFPMSCALSNQLGLKVENSKSVNASANNAVTENSKVAKPSSKIPTLAIKRKGSLLNTYYIIKAEKSWGEVSKAIYDVPNLGVNLEFWNPDVKIKEGAVVFFPSDSEQTMKPFEIIMCGDSRCPFFGEDDELPPPPYTWESLRSIEYPLKSGHTYEVEAKLTITETGEVEPIDGTVTLGLFTAAGGELGVPYTLTPKVLPLKQGVARGSVTIKSNGNLKEMFVSIRSFQKTSDRSTK